MAQSTYSKLTKITLDMHMHMHMHFFIGQTAYCTFIHIRNEHPVSFLRMLYSKPNDLNVNAWLSQ